MSKMIVGVDIDNTVVDSNYYWTDYLLKHHRIYPYLSWEMHDKCKALGYRHYDVSKVFAEFISKDEALDFWRYEHLYNDMKPMDGVQNILYKMHELGHDIVFISALKGNHHKSKVQFVKKFFPFYAAFLGTKEKEYVKVDMMIDDNYEILNRFTNPNVQLIHFDRGYIDHKDKKFLRTDIIRMDRWTAPKERLVFR